MKNAMSRRETTLLEHLGQRRLELVFTQARIAALGRHGADTLDGMLQQGIKALCQTWLPIALGGNLGRAQNPGDVSRGADLLHDFSA